jgi:uncharacterized protein
LKKNYLTLSDALKIQGPKAFIAMNKPVGSKCNLDCTYCYYLDKERFYGKKQEIFSDTFLEKYIKEYIEANEVPVVSFVWHGGEPLLAGVDFYRKVIHFQNKHNVNHKRIENSIQTNGTLINDDWCRFLKKNNFLVGVSIDGPEDIHNRYRVNKQGLQSFEKCIRGIELLKKHKVDFNTLTVVNNLSQSRGREIYRFLKSIGSHYMQFLPAVDFISRNTDYERPVIVSPLIESDAIQAPWSVSSEGYAQFLIDVFNEWIIQDVGQYFVQLFDLTLEAWYGYESSVCVYSETCGNNIAVEHNGDVFSCDHFVFPEHFVGNLNMNSLREILSSPKQIKFGIDKRNTLSNECLLCNYYFACGGECPKHRHLPTKDGEKKFALCEGLKMYYKHSEPFMKYMVDLLRQEQGPYNVMPWARIALGINI